MMPTCWHAVLLACVARGKEIACGSVRVYSWQECTSCLGHSSTEQEAYLSETELSMKMVSSSAFGPSAISCPRRPEPPAHINGSHLPSACRCSRLLSCCALRRDCLHAQARAACPPTGSRRQRRMQSCLRALPAPRTRPQAARRLRLAPNLGGSQQTLASRALLRWGMWAHAWRLHQPLCLERPPGPVRRPAKGRLLPKLLYPGRSLSPVRRAFKAWLLHRLLLPMRRRWQRRCSCCSAALRRWPRRRPRLRRRRSWRAWGTWGTLGLRVGRNGRLQGGAAGGAGDLWRHGA